MFLDSFAGLGYLSMFLLGNIRYNNNLAGGSLKILAVILPLLVAMFVGISRINDYRHHWSDVVGGALLGTTNS
jgi:diacylglycerol diphosphate phosphatase / phosphatidate phosphatase